MDQLRHQLSALFVALALGACGGAAAADDVTAAAAEPADVAPLRGGVDDLDELGRAVVAGLNARDAAALDALLVDEADFKGRLFTALSRHPNAQQMGPELLWDMQRRQGADELARAIELHGGQALRYLGLEAGRIERRGDIRLHRRPTLLVEVGGAPQRLQLLGSIVEHVPSGSFKLVTYRMRG